MEFCGCWRMKCNRLRHRTASKVGFGVFLLFWQLAASQGHTILYLLARLGHEAGQWIHWGHGWAPDSNAERREWARKKLQAEELCEKVSICGTLDSTQNKQVKIKPQKDSQSPCLKFLQTEDLPCYHFKGLRNCQFCGLSHHNTTSDVWNSYAAGWGTAGSRIREADRTEKFKGKYYEMFTGAIRKAVWVVERLLSLAFVLLTAETSLTLMLTYILFFNTLKLQRQCTLLTLISVNVPI